MPRPTTKKGATPHQRGLLHGYRSGSEVKLGAKLEERGISFLFEPAKIAFIQPEKKRTYTGDYVVRRDGGPVTYSFEDPKWFVDPAFWAEHMLLECKGRFMPDDRQKHVWIKKQIPITDIRFIFDRSSSKISKTSKTTYAAWCVKNGFLYADREPPEDWFTE